MADETNLNVDTPIGDLSNLADAPDDALLVVEYLGKAYNSTLGQLKAALGAITSFERTQGDGTPGSTDVYTVTFANGGKLEMPIPIAKNGTDGVSPTAKATATDTGWHVVITDKNGEHPFDITNGKNGANGVSPTAEVTATDTGWHVVITDKDGEHPFDITNGKNGANGVSPTASVSATDEGWHVVITDKNGEHPFDLLHGQNGTDGVSPDVSVQQVSGGYRVTITDKGGAHYFTLKHGESSSADWAQKYPDGAGYVENRIAYKDVYGVDGEVITENVNFITSVANTTGLMKDALEPGGKYVVRWNNQPYHCICKESLTDGPYIGNGALFGGAEDLENTGEPFCIYRFTEDYYQIIKDTDTEETIFVEVYGFAVTDLKRMDDDLLPEGYPYRETVETDIIPKKMITFSDGLFEYKSAVELTVGGQYLVNWDDKEYQCVGKEYVTEEMTSVCIGDVSSLTGGESTGEPFAVVMIPADMTAELGYYARIYKHSGMLSVATITVTEVKDVVHPMDKDLLPPDLAGGVTDYNDLKNRPFGSDGMKTVEILPETTVEIDPDGGVGAITDTSVTAAKEGQAYTVNWNGTNYHCTARAYVTEGITAGNLLGNAGAMTGGEDTGEPFVIVCALPETVELLGAPGAVFALDGSASVTLSIKTEVEDIDKMEGKFLPEGTPYTEPLNDVILSEFPLEEGTSYFTVECGKLIEGNIYKVQWGDTPYFIKARNVNGAMALGEKVYNGSVPYEDVPFGLTIFNAPSAEGYTGFLTYIGQKPDSFSVVGHLAVTEIGDDCLPESAVPFWVTFEGDSNNVSVTAADRSYTEIFAAFSRGKVVMGKLVGESSIPTIKIFQLASASVNGCTFMCADVNSLVVLRYDSLGFKTFKYDLSTLAATT